MSMSYEDIASYLDAQQQRGMAVMLRQLLLQLRDCREANAQTMQAYYALRNKYEPRTQHVPTSYRSPPESDG